jgi:hypothetical protein
MDENQRAWHAGDSQWQGRTWLNSSSIGIEIVNPGFKDTPTGRLWYPYSEAQVQSLIVLLKDISKRHAISPRSIIGHSDIAPLRKLDPGPLFPWKRLASEGIGIWPNEQAVARQQAISRHSCRASPGFRHSWPASVTTHRKPANWTWQPATCSPPFKCTSGRHATTEPRTHKRQPSFRCLIRQNNDARPAVNALSQSAAITHW